MSDYEMYVPLSGSFSHPAFVRGNERGRLVSVRIPSQQNYIYVSSSATRYQISFSIVFSQLAEMK